MSFEHSGDEKGIPAKDDPNPLLGPFLSPAWPSRQQWCTWPSVAS